MSKVFLEHSGEKRIEDPPFDSWFEPHIMRRQGQDKTELNILI